MFWNNLRNIILITVGATLYKCVNRAAGTLVAGVLGFGVHWMAIQCGEEIEPIVLEISVFLLGISICNCFFMVHTLVRIHSYI